MFPAVNFRGGGIWTTRIPSLSRRREKSPCGTVGTSPTSGGFVALPRIFGALFLAEKNSRKKQWNKQVSLEKGPCLKEFSSSNHQFAGDMLVFRGVVGSSHWSVTVQWVQGLATVVHKLHLPKKSEVFYLSDTSGSGGIYSVPPIRKSPTFPIAERSQLKTSPYTKSWFTGAQKRLSQNLTWVKQDSSWTVKSPLGEDGSQTLQAQPENKGSVEICFSNTNLQV